MPASIAVSYDSTKLGAQPVWANREAIVAFFDSLSIAVGVSEADVGAVKVQGALADVAQTVAESNVSITALNSAGNTVVYTVPSIDYADSLKTNVEELQTLYAALQTTLINAGITV